MPRQTTIRAEGSDVSDVGAAFRRPVHVLHVAGEAAIQPVAEEPELHEVGGRRNPAEIETEGGGAAFDLSGGDAVGHRPAALPAVPGVHDHSAPTIGLLPDELPQHVRQDAAVSERDEFFGRIDPPIVANQFASRAVLARARTVTSPRGLSG